MYTKNCEVYKTLVYFERSKSTVAQKAQTQTKKKPQIKERKCNLKKRTRK